MKDIKTEDKKKGEVIKGEHIVKMDLMENVWSITYCTIHHTALNLYFYLDFWQ